MKTLLTILLIILISASQALAQDIIINHTCSKITQIPELAIIAAKQKLHIAYGHTSHGSQLTYGMASLDTFMNRKGYPKNLYAWNNGGKNGALDLHDYAMAGDVGYFPDWVNNTRKYLGDPNIATGRGSGTNADVNVIIWSWCGQVTSKYQTGKLMTEYINPMVQLEADYPGIKFVYMTGHLYHPDDATTKAANKTIRDFCVNNNKILYDFADIESYDPDSVYYEFTSDDCSFYESAKGKLLGNWAINWQNSHTENVDWYNCNSAHSQPLNANQKAYAAWWLWASLAGWNQSTDIIENQQINQIVSISPNPVSDYLTINTNLEFDKIEIYNTLGLMVLETDRQEKIDVSTFPPGVYFIKVGDKVCKFVKM
jgi:hypothetical protein